MKFFSVEKQLAGSQTDLIESGLAFVRWQLKLAGFNFLTVYRQEIHIEAPPGHMEPTTYIRQWWFYACGPFENWGFGLKVPVSVSRKLGLSTPAPPCCANVACRWSSETESGDS